MAKSFDDYVRSGRLRKNFDAAVERAAEEAKQLGLRRSVQPLEAGTDAAVPSPAGDKTAAPSMPDGL